jgi:serpin B
LEKFPEERTEDGEFFTLDGETVMVPMMSYASPQRFRYQDGDTYQAVELPYVGNKVSMLVLVPDQGAFEEFEASLNMETLSAIIQGMESQAVDLTFPKFEFESELSLAEVLVDMGMPAAMSPGADFSGMTGSKDLFISDVFHKAFVSVDEEGTEAAAATAVVMTESAMPASPVKITVDRPFLFLIRDNETGAVLFLGRVLNPVE